MRSISIVVLVEAPPDRVWAELADLESHPEWMGDAGSVEFATARTEGVGTRMRVPTRVGPFRTTDLMTVVEWEEGSLIAVEHEGAVSGRGRFEIRPLGPGTELTWSETLTFPWWLGGSLGAWIARPILRGIWRGNLERLRRRLEVSDP
jgi:uncharacterized protein YndB with AHSA1/START domain